MAMVGVDYRSPQLELRLTAQAEGWQPPLSAVVRSSNESDELWQWLCRDYSTINSVLVLSAVAVIINYFYITLVHYVPKNTGDNFVSS